MNVITTTWGLGLVALVVLYAVVLAHACQGAFCDFDGDPGPHPLRRIAQGPRRARSWVRGAPGRLIDAAWGLFDLPGAERAFWPEGDR